MQKSLITWIFCGFTFVNNAQDVSVEKSVFGLQTGLIGVWAHHEAKLNNAIALRSEIGLDAGFFGGSWWDETLIVLAPSITVEPRWYYNLNRRVAKNKRIDGNSGNFISIKSTYLPDWFVISNSNNVSVIEHVQFVPTYGLKRNIGKHWQYEAGFGLGYRYLFLKQYGSLHNQSELAANLHLRIGYRF